MCILLPDGMLFPISSQTNWRAKVFFPINFLQFLYISSCLSCCTNLTIILFLTFFISGSLCAVEMSFTPMSTSRRDPTSYTNCLGLSWGTSGIPTISRQSGCKYCCTSSMATSLLCIKFSTFGVVLSKSFHEFPSSCSFWFAPWVATSKQLYL